MDYDQNVANTQSDSNTENEMLQLRQENSLLYYRPSQACLVSYRQQKIQPFSNQSVNPGNIAQVLVNCDDFISGPTSYLKVSFDIVTAGNLVLSDLFGLNGSILNLYQSAKLYHRSGQVLEEINNRLAQLMTIKRFYLYNESERAQLDSILGVNNAVPPTPTIVPAGSYTFSGMIPLSLMFGSFNEHKQLIPPSFLSGAKMELGIYPLNSIIADPLAGLNIQNINMSLLLDACTIYDSAKKSIMEEVNDVKASGLQYVYDTNFFTTSTAFQPTALTPVQGQAFNFDVQQSNAIVKNVFFVATNETEIDTKLGVTSTKHPFYNIVQTLQFRLGSQYYPNQSMNLVPRSSAVGSATTTFIENSSQAYQNVVMAFDSQTKQFGSYVNTNSITKARYMSTENIADAKLAVFGILLDRGPGQAVSYSGVPSNNSRLLNISGTISKNLAAVVNFVASTAAVNTIFVWTTSTRVANCIGDSLILDR